MKLLLDENLSPRLIASLENDYPDSEHVHTCGLGSADDNAVWEYARVHGFIIVSKDSDSTERSILYRNSPKVIWIRAGNCSTRAIETLLHGSSDRIRRFVEDDKETCLILSR